MLSVQVIKTSMEPTNPPCIKKGDAISIDNCNQAQLLVQIYLYIIYTPKERGLCACEKPMVMAEQLVFTVRRGSPFAPFHWCRVQVVVAAPRSTTSVITHI
jgi:hypothetical protein